MREKALGLAHRSPAQECDPFDPKSRSGLGPSPRDAGGTTRGFGPAEFREIGGMMPGRRRGLRKMGEGDERSRNRPGSRDFVARASDLPGL